jgi:hypothetical protein
MGRSFAVGREHHEVADPAWTTLQDIVEHGNDAVLKYGALDAKMHAVRRS